MVSRALLMATALALAVPAAWAGDPPSTASSSSASAQKSSTPPKQLLDLTTPDFHKVVPAKELEADLNAPDEEDDDAPPPEVAVRGHKPAPSIPSGYASIWWAFTHPSEFWRIFAPVQ